MSREFEARSDRIEIIDLKIKENPQPLLRKMRIATYSRNVLVSL